MPTLVCFSQEFHVEGLSASEFDQLVKWTGFSGSPDTPSSPAGRFEFSQSDGHYRLEGDNATICSGQTLELTFELVRSRVHRYLNGVNPEAVFLSADAVRWTDGRAILIVGTAMSGKSTLARALVQAGGAPWSEHFAVLTEESTLAAYPSPENSSESIPVACILCAPYRPGAVWQPKSLSAGESVLCMMGTLGDRSAVMPTTMPRLAKLASQAGMRVMGERGDTASVVAHVLEQLSGQRLAL